MTGGQKFCLRWDGFKSRLSSVFDELRREEELLDVTLCCDGGHAVKAHQILLSASSPSLRQLLKSNPCQHPVFFLKETSAEDLHAIIQFIYCGEVNVVQSQLASFIKTAEMLQIRGLSGDSDGDEDQTEQVDLSDDEGPSMDDPLGFFSSFEGHVDAGSAAGPSSRDSHGGPSTALDEHQLWLQDRQDRLERRQRVNQLRKAVIDFDESPRRPVPPAPFKNFRIRQTRYWYLGMAQSIIDQFPFVFSHLNRRDAMGLVARRLKNKFKNSRRISTNKNEMRHGLSGLDDSPGSSVARRNSDENATEASNDPNITSLEQQSDGSTGAKGSDVTTNKAPQIPDIDQVSDHGSEELSTADDVDVLDEAS
ncbi:Broad-complex core protein isoforms 1/2/3/4/5 [Amphibalanus amphitrite]|uniref:Broad-complex core protein isoforms 1/2/3/4/5 n=1 Tax=Amphibalanus amphitrite TaxID=1232801 RepID=A0A6A4WJN5_AMPAM|nr:Broad-complex core protein isoforms 1/2/3/4/5 [Amphibalanus amphitrite]